MITYCQRIHEKESILILPVVACLLVFCAGCASSEKAAAKAALARELDTLAAYGAEPDAAPKAVSLELSALEEPDFVSGRGADGITKSASGNNESAYITPLLEEDDAELSDQVLRLYFQDYSYQIGEITLDRQRKTASADVTVRTPDAKSLVKDMAITVLKQQAVKNETEPLSAKDCYGVLIALLTENQYAKTDTTFSVTLEKQSENWVLTRSEDLSDHLSGGLVSSLSDNEILSADEALGAYLDLVRELSPEELLAFLVGDSDPSALGWDENAWQIAMALAKQLGDCFSYEILSCEESGSYTDVSCSITTFDSQAIMSRYQESFLAYMDSAQAVIDGEEVRDQKSFEILLKVIEGNTAVKTVQATFSMIFDGTTWRLGEQGQQLGDILFPGVF